MIPRRTARSPHFLALCFKYKQEVRAEWRSWRAARSERSVEATLMLLRSEGRLFNTGVEIVVMLLSLFEH